MLSDATSGLKCAQGFNRSSTIIVGAPPVVMFTTTLHACLMRLRKGSNASGRWSGRPSFGSRACRWTIAAPASHAPSAAAAISSAVIGRCGDIVGVWIAPVTAQVITTLRLRFGLLAMRVLLVGSIGRCRFLRALARDEGGEALVAPQRLGGDLGGRELCLHGVGRAQPLCVVPDARW